MSYRTALVAASIADVDRRRMRNQGALATGAKKCKEKIEVAVNVGKDGSHSF